jgi:hypothetical protein
MTYLRPALAPMGRRNGRGGALGDVVQQAQGSVAELAREVNRFGPEAPAALQFAPTPFPVVDSVKLDPALALVALTIYQRRAADAYAQFHDQGSLAALEAANQGFINPVGFVGARLAEVTTAVRGYGDASGLPSASGPSVSSMLGGDLTIPIVIAVGAAALWMFKRSR